MVKPDSSQPTITILYELSVLLQIFILPHEHDLAGVDDSHSKTNTNAKTITMAAVSVSLSSQDTARASRASATSYMICTLPIGLSYACR